MLHVSFMGLLTNKVEDFKGSCWHGPLHLSSMVVVLSSHPITRGMEAGGLWLAGICRRQLDSKLHLGVSVSGVRRPRGTINREIERLRLFLPNTQMSRHLISDAHEWINEVPTVPAYYLAKPPYNMYKNGAVL